MDDTTRQAIQIRPTYEWASPLSPEDWIKRVAALCEDNQHIDISWTSRHAALQVPDDEQHTWSPYLDLYAQDGTDGQDGCLIHGKLGPHPHIWTMFMAIYAAIAFLALMGAMWGLSLMVLKQPPWPLLAVPAALLAGGALHVASIVGRGLGSDQVHHLLAVVDHALDDPTHLNDHG